ncbi:MAG: hypothetical protein JNK05_13575 [Myxococcales bacterium]|nr:hypothetical protein [Myxococcales bacterium]
MSTNFHPYAHENQEAAQRWLFFPALVLAFGLGKVLEVVHAPWWIDTPAPFGFLAALAWFFNKWGWHAFRRIHDIPDLRGTYDLEIRSSNDQHEKPIKGTLTIAQEWTRILVTVKTATSSSSSIGAWLSDDPTQGAVLTYAYRNEPDPAAKEDLHAHSGTAKITFASDGTARGRYYNDRDRVTFGSMTLTKRAAAGTSAPPVTVAASTPTTSPPSDATGP